ncbi:VOC family protein [Niveispirillum sp.]|uniref:VOC family protein n=1 Tax=Niveispirillum sp. TaxID=1917217 RepID=UPI001B63B80A|nr:VOC family protein [Niveispirillum sp.]MBP7338236.1 VOC family protein [Niveispirillum sp.]
MTDRPEYAHNTTGVIPHLVVNGAREAIEFYIKAFGATKVMEMPAEDGKRLLHAQLIVNGGPLMLCDDFPEYCGGQPTEYPKRPPVTLHMAVADIDAAFAQAVAAGAAEAMKPADMFWGDRYGQVRDPYGHLWSLSTPSKPGAVVTNGC